MRTLDVAIQVISVYCFYFARFRTCRAFERVIVGAGFSIVLSSQRREPGEAIHWHSYYFFLWSTLNNAPNANFAFSLHSFSSNPSFLFCLLPLLSWVLPQHHRLCKPCLFASLPNIGSLNDEWVWERHAMLKWILKTRIWRNHCCSNRHEFRLLTPSVVWRARRLDLHSSSFTSRLIVIANSTTVRVAHNLLRPAGSYYGCVGKAIYATALSKESLVVLHFCFVARRRSGNRINFKSM